MRIYCVCGCLFVILLSGVFGDNLHEPTTNVRDKRTLGFILKTIGDAIGYDVLKRPSLFSIPPIPPIIPPPPPKAPAAPPKPAAPAAPPPPPKVPPAAPPKAPPPKVPPAAPPAKPAAKAPAPPPPPPPPPPPAPKPQPPPAVPKAPTAPPLLTETIQKMFNINFNWNKNVQPQPAPAAPPKPAPPPPPPPPPPPKPAAAPPAPAPPKSAPPAKSPPEKSPPAKYQEAQENFNSHEEQQIIYYPDEDVSNEEKSKENYKNDYNEFPQTVQIIWQNSHGPWDKNAIPEYQEYLSPNGEHQYHVHHYQQQHSQAPDEQNTNEQQKQHYQEDQREEIQDYQEQEIEQQSQEQTKPKKQEDGNVEDSKSFFLYHQPRGFSPSYHGDYYHPGLPLTVHGVHEDKVLVAWPSPFELAGSEIKNKKIAPSDQMQNAGSDNNAYVYEPESYGEYNFYTIPPPSKNEYQNYEAPSDPKIEEELSSNAQIKENNYGNKYVKVITDKNTYNH